MEGRMKATKWMTLAAVAVMATACGGDDDKGTGPNGRLGDFSAEVSGDVEADLDGWSLFGNVDDPEAGTGFGLIMSEIEDENDDDGSVITIVRLNSTTVGNGQHDISDFQGELEDGDFVAMAMDQVDGELAALFYSTGGTFTVTTSNAQSLRGTFAIDMVGFVMEDPETELNVTVEGEFDAKRGDDESARVRIVKTIKSVKSARQAR
jgi:hypothetical protein